ncbi:rifin PIR protein, putative [Plasmodium reichenowi]|uniref:Rifin PIR protein, putative n=1 Tax=Plasmodium reichenowi TaxID=5854 RepID=A0A2P9DD81_PLARE|nr:rifin PIR protein, putative [Plasmodium reichenowi]
MKVHYINILLFALPLNILAHNKNKASITPRHTHTTRLLCECDLYIPNYDNDPQMKKVMQQFEDRTSQRFHVYDERMQITRQKYKEQCDKEIQKIILKDKLEKELTEKLTTLETNIDINDIPTCVCEKSVADKTEKFCLKCGKTMGAVAPSCGLVSGVGYVAWTQYVAAKVLEEGIKNGLEVGLLKVTEIVTKMTGSHTSIPKFNVVEMLSSGYFTEKMSLFDISNYINTTMSAEIEFDEYAAFSLGVQNIAEKSTLITKSYPTQVAAVTNAVIEGKTKAINAAAPATNALTTSIIASVISIVVIVLFMVIIYLILHYRRKKKMKKKLKYIKLLKE